MHRAARAQQFDRLRQPGGVERAWRARARDRFAGHHHADRAGADPKRRDPAPAPGGRTRPPAHLRRRLGSSPMSRVRPLPVAALAAAGSLLWTGSAQAAAHKPPAHAPKRTPAPAPATPPPIASGAPGSLQLVAQRVLGNSAFVLVGGRFVIQGVVWPYVGRQQVKVSLYRDGRKVAVKRLGVVAVGNGSGAFRFSYASSRAGVVQARVVHYATPVQAQFIARTRRIHFVSPNLRGGARGGSVQVLQSELNALHYVVPL